MNGIARLLVTIGINLVFVLVHVAWMTAQFGTFEGTVRLFRGVPTLNIAEDGWLYSPAPMTPT